MSFFWKKKKAAQKGAQESKKGVEMEETYLMEDKDGFLVSVPASRLEQWQAAQERAEQNRPDAADSVRDRIRSEIVRRVYHTDTDE